MRRAAILVALTGSLAAADSSRKVAPVAAVEDSCSDGSGTACKRHALDGFAAALAAQRAGTAAHPLRISYVGDSLTADDQITHALRTRLAALVGDGGPGFTFAAPPHPYCQHRTVTRVITGPWRVHGLSKGAPPDHLLGLGGSAETVGGGTIRWVTKTPVTRIDIHYLAQPRGGSFAVLADGANIGAIETTADRKRAAFAQLEVPEGAKKIELVARGRVRLFGASLEAAKGAVVDNLGVVNATAKQVVTNNHPEHLRNQLARRGPDLVIVMLGTNEAEWIAAKSSGMAEHERLFGDLLATVRAANPKSSCLVVSPLDQIDWRVEAMPARESIPAMVDAQRRAATARGCAFWDTYAWMGGTGSSKQWFKRGLVMKDFQHPTTAGSTRIADALYRALVTP
ncbi:MAG: hypothetical protein H0T42_13225 [Deltaproteobacteria bacterium]|nr:hypothetical protein [Deltaproteobacteria bacterium]